MSATTESQRIEKLAILAGGGSLPGLLLKACDSLKIDPFVVAFKGQTDPYILEGRQYMRTRLGRAGKILATLKSHEIRDIVMIGGIHRPSLTELRPDLRTAAFFTKIGFRAMGDDGLLQAIRHELEEEGFNIHGVQEFLNELLCPEGLFGHHKPGKNDLVDITRGVEVATALGVLDVGQSVIVQEGIVLGVEGAEGTDELIRRCKSLKRAEKGGVLVKLCKPQQDKRLDLPTIGLNTVKLCAECGFHGIAVHAGHSLVVDPQDVAELADKHNMFVLGILPEGVSS